MQSKLPTCPPRPKQKIRPDPCRPGTKAGLEAVCSQLTIAANAGVTRNQLQWHHPRVFFILEDLPRDLHMLAERGEIVELDAYNQGSIASPYQTSPIRRGSRRAFLSPYLPLASSVFLLCTREVLTLGSEIGHTHQDLPSCSGIKLYEGIGRDFWAIWMLQD